MTEITIIIITLVASAFFSGMEIAFITSNRLRIELDRKQGAFGAGITRLTAGGFGFSPEAAPARAERVSTAAADRAVDRGFMASP